MHHRNDPDVVGFDEVDDAIRKSIGKVPPRRRIKLPEELRPFAYFVNQLLHFAKEARAQFRADPNVVVQCLAEFAIGILVDYSLHKPAILRASSSALSSGMPLA